MAPDRARVPQPPAPCPAHPLLPLVARPALPTPQAFVCFENPEEARRACQKDRETFSEKWGDRYVRVYPTLESDVADMQQAVLQQNMVHTQVRGGLGCGGPRCRSRAVM